MSLDFKVMTLNTKGTLVPFKPKWISHQTSGHSYFDSYFCRINLADGRISLMSHVSKQLNKDFPNYVKHRDDGCIVSWNVLETTKNEKYMVMGFDCVDELNPSDNHECQTPLTVDKLNNLSTGSVPIMRGLLHQARPDLEIEKVKLDKVFGPRATVKSFKIGVDQCRAGINGPKGHPFVAIPMDYLLGEVRRAYDVNTTDKEPKVSQPTATGNLSFFVGTNQ